MTEVERIRQLLDDRIAAMREGDARAVIGQYTPDAVVFSLAPPLQQPTGAGRDVEGLQAWFDEKGGRVGAEIRDVTVAVAGDVAYCHGLQRMGSPDDAPGPAFTLWYRATYGLRRTNEGWRIAHEHQSTPFYMDESMRAAVDLAP